MSNIGFIGAGNMGGALARAAAKSAHNIYLSDKDSAKAAELANEIGAIAAKTSDIIEACDLIFIGVKPQFAAALAEEIREALSSRTTPFCLVSFMAGVTLQKLGDLFGSYPAIRMMPNTAVAVGQGMIAWCANDGASEEHKALFAQALAHAGASDQLQEHLIDAATAVMGCGPAYVYLFIEALADGGVKCGLPRDKALLYAEQMVHGAAALALNSGKHPGELKDAVCSPGGSTIAGVAALEEGGFRGLTLSAVEAAYRRTQQLG